MTTVTSNDTFTRVNFRVSQSSISFLSADSRNTRRAADRNLRTHHLLRFCMAARRKSQRLPDHDGGCRSAHVTASASRATPARACWKSSSLFQTPTSCFVPLFLLFSVLRTAEYGAATGAPYRIPASRSSVSPHRSIRMPLMPSGRPMVNFHRMAQPTRSMAGLQGMPAGVAATTAGEQLGGLRAQGGESLHERVLGASASAGDHDGRAGATARMALSDLKGRGDWRGSSRKVGPGSPAATSSTGSGSSKSSSSAPRLGSNLVYPTSLAISYHDGPLMTGTVPVYLIFYGNWGAGAGQDVIETFVRSITDSSADEEVSSAGRRAAGRHWRGILPPPTPPPCPPPHPRTRVPASISSPLLTCPV